MVPRLEALGFFETQRSLGCVVWDLEGEGKGRRDGEKGKGKRKKEKGKKEKGK